MEALSTTQFGKYHLIRHLAHGGMSDIYLAHNESDEQLYAIKLVKQDVSENYLHFCREMSILSTLQHEHILPILDYSAENEEIAYYVMPYIEQGSLKERIIAGPLSLEEAATILTQVGDALQFIHESGLIHRDIKPANILLDATNHVWLADFGLAKKANTPSELTGAGYVLGTPFYLAPELLEEAATASSDIYALGIVLYEMLTGRPPFRGPTPLAICLKHLYEPPPLPSVFNPLISPSVERVILRALAKKPGRRFSTVRELTEAYQQALLSPATLPESEEKSLEPIMLARMEKVSIIIKPIQPQLVALSRQPHRLPLVAAMVMLATLFLLGATGLTIEYQAHPSISTNARAAAQMISLPDRTPTSIRSATPTVKPTAIATPAPTQTISSNVSNQGSDDTQPSKGHKHKHPKKND